MKKQLLFIGCLVLLLCGGCKKDAQPNGPKEEEIQAEGIWSLISDVSLYNGAVTTYTTAQFPCIEGNKIFINPNGVASLEYTRQDTCYVYRTATSSITYGIPGEKRSATWTQNDKTIIIQASNPTRPLVAK